MNHATLPTGPADYKIEWQADGKNHVMTGVGRVVVTGEFSLYSQMYEVTITTGNFVIESRAVPKYMRDNK